MSRSKGLLGRVFNFTGKRKLTSILLVVLVVLVFTFLFRQNLAKLFSGADEADNIITNKASLSYIDSQGSPKTVDSNIVSTLITTPVPVSPSPTLDTTTFTFSKKGWYIFSFATQPVDPNPATIFNGNEGNPNGINPDAIIYRWDTAKDSLVNYDAWTPEAFGNFEIGTGYWIEIKENNVGKSISYQSVANPSVVTVNLNSKTGDWAIVGNPFNETIHSSAAANNIKFKKDGGPAVSWEEAQNNGWVEPIGSKWDAQLQSLIAIGCSVGSDPCWADSDEIKANEGFWIQTKTTGISIEFSK